MLSSSLEYRKHISDLSDRDEPVNLTAKAKITLTSGEVLDIGEEDIVIGGFGLSDAVSGGTFEVGSAIINELSIGLNNIERKFSMYDFDGARVIAHEGAILTNRTEWFQKGIYTVDEAEVSASVIKLSCLDDMQKLDRAFSDVSVYFPCTAGELLQAVCLHCAVPLATTTFTSSDYIISRSPDEESVTCREIVSWIAQLSGTFARCNNIGFLELKWYDISAFERNASLDGGHFDSSIPYASGDIADGGDFSYLATDSVDGGTFLDMGTYHHIIAQGQLSIGTDDIVITGVRVKAMGTKEDYGETFLFGQDGYVVEITDNELITENNAQIIATSVGAQLVGMRFRTFDTTTLQDPTREAGDAALLTDNKQNTYMVLLSDIRHTLGALDRISCEAESPGRNNAQRYSLAAKAVVAARKNTERQLTVYDEVVRNITDTISNGLGLYTTTVGDESDGRITYQHEKPNMSQSLIRWFRTSEGYIQQTRADISEDWVTTAGEDIYGNALFNTIVARGLIADWIVSGSLKSRNYEPDVDGMHIDLDDGTIDSKNFKLSSAAGVSATGKFETTQLAPSGEEIKSTLGDGGVRVSVDNVEVGRINSGSALGVRGIALSSETLIVIRTPTKVGYIYNPADLVTTYPERHFVNGNCRITGRTYHSSVAFMQDIVSTDNDHTQDVVLQRQTWESAPALAVDKSLYVYGNFGVGGTKNRIVATKNYGQVALNAMETAEPYFTDIGSAKVSESGEVTIFFDPVFWETIEADCDYQVFITRTSKNETTWVEKQSGFFIVYGEAGATFDWMLCCKQKNYSTMRMESFIASDEAPEEGDFEI